jgi:hypothetical protein
MAVVDGPGKRRRPPTDDAAQAAAGRKRAFGRSNIHGYQNERAWPALPGRSAHQAAGLEDIDPDPFKMAELIGSVEKVSGIDLPDDDFDGLLTVGDLIAHVKRKRT